MRRGPNTTASVAAPLKVSVAQAERLLQEIATTANIARHLALEAPDDQLSPTVQALQMMAERIGGLADIALGGAVVGSFAEWTLGFDFDEAGR